MKSFNEQVYEIVAQIPSGSVTTYGQIARIIGRPRMARFVGFAMNNPKMGHLPWHRVTFADGRLCPNWEKIQYKMLRAEGIGFTRDRRIKLESHFWSGPSGMRPPELKDAPIVF